MNPQLREDITERLVHEYNARVDSSPYLNKIECPSCHKREAFTSAEAPWMIKCGRENKCGDNLHVKDLFPDLFETWTERYTPKQEDQRTANPTAVADGYLQDGRGFDLEKIKGWYTQEYYQDHKINQGTTTVRFPLPKGFWERLLDKPQRFGKQKARIVGSYKGQVWVPGIFSMVDLAAAKEIWIVEGIFDAIALLHAGIVAVSNISSSNYPELFLGELKAACGTTGQRPVLVWAQDSDKAGRNACIKFRDRAEADNWACDAAQIPLLRGRQPDWNDLHQLSRLQDKHLQEYRYEGSLLLAKSAGAKALLIYQHSERREFWFDFGARLWWWKLDTEAYERELNALDKDSEELTTEQRERLLRSAGLVTCVCSASPRPLYFQANHLTDESWYYFAVDMPEDGSQHKKPFTAKQLTSSAEFKNRLLSIAKNAWWSGTGKQLDRIMQDQMENLKTVETIDFVGYTKDHGCYIFTDVAIREGKVVALNSEDYFEFGRLSLKTLAQSPELQINTDLAEYKPEWLQHVASAFGPAGVVTTAFWLGSLFAEQIRAKHKSYPFLELVGEAGAGKSTLIEFLWKTCGRSDYEGIDPSKATVAARGRHFAQVSNLPVVLIESDREADKTKQRQFDWDELKTAFNGRAIRSRGVKNGGNDTYDPPFRGAIAISQNAAVEASEAILSRIVHITVTRAGQSEFTKTNAEWLERIPMEQVSGFVLSATRNEKKLLEEFELQAAHYEQFLLGLDEIRFIRIAKCHAQMMALAECLGPRVLNLIDEPVLVKTRAYIVEMAKSRQQAINADNPVVTEFWEAFDYIEGLHADLRLNHYGNDGDKIAVNLKEFERWCGEHKLRAPETRQLKQLLRTSKSRKFVDANRSVRSKILDGKTVKCWVFQKEAE